jgi:Na+/H+ antiporter NhaD/arsenite permease-like protein
VLLARRRWAFMPLGRTMGAAGCAVLMVGVESSVLPVERLLDLSGVVDLSSLATLFSLTIVTGVMGEVGLLQRGAELVSRNCNSPLKLLLRVVAVTTMTAALFTNDAAVTAISDPKSC